MIRETAAIVESVYAPAIREINALEQRIADNEDAADAQLWDQARIVVAQLDAGMSQRELARQWMNVRTGEAYSERHVRIVRQVCSAYLNTHPRPRFRDVYNAITNNNARDAHNSGDFEWYTPTEYVEAARAVMGAIDLDPASNATANTVVRATTFYTAEQDGLAQHWRGRVWMNPPYRTDLVEQFAAKFAEHVAAGDVSAGIVLVNNATATQWFRTLTDAAVAICFPYARVHFWKPEQSSDQPLHAQALIYAGRAPMRFYQQFRGFGWTGLTCGRSAMKRGSDGQ